MTGSALFSLSFHTSTPSLLFLFIVSSASDIFQVCKIYELLTLYTCSEVTIQMHALTHYEATSFSNHNSVTAEKLDRAQQALRTLSLCHWCCFQRAVPLGRWVYQGFFITFFEPTHQGQLYLCFSGNGANYTNVFQLLIKSNHIGSRAKAISVRIDRCTWEIPLPAWNFSRGSRQNQRSC